MSFSCGGGKEGPVLKKLSVCILFGGVSSEHEVSLRSAESVLNHIDKDKYNIFPVGITKDGKWIINGEDPRGWNLDGGELPTVKITPESRPVMLDPSRGQDGFFIPATSIPPIPASAPASSACPTRKCTMC